MHVAFVVPRFHPYPGGYENYILWLARHLRASGHTVTILTTTAYDLQSFWLGGFRDLPPGPAEIDGIKVLRQPIAYNRWVRRAGRVLALLPSWRLKARFARPSFPVSGLAAQLRKLPPFDVIHVGPLPYNRLMYQGWREGRRRGARVLATPCTHFGEDGDRQVSQHYTRPFQIELLRHCDGVLALTNMERERLITNGVPKDRVWTTGAGIDAAEVTGGNAAELRAKYGINGPLVLHLGTKAPDKGTLTVLEAMRQLWAAGCDAWLALVGSSVSEFDEYLRRHPATSSRLLNLGPVSSAEKRDLLAAATILVHPSRVESLGLVYLEAWANGHPVIAADTPVSREVVTAEGDGLLVPFGNGDLLAGAIRRLLDDPNLRRSLGQAGKKKVETQFSWKAAADRIYPFFQPQQNL